MKEDIIKNGKIYGIIWYDDFPKGSTWISNDEDNIQVGLFHYDKNKHLRSHTHNIYDRMGTRTCEAMYVISGSVMVTVLDEKKEIIKKIILAEGGIYISLAGGHYFDVLENETRIFEAKNGPYFGVEKDKIFYE